MALTRLTKAVCNGHPIFHRLCRALCTCWEEWMGRITQKRDSAFVRDPSWEGISINQFPVHLMVAMSVQEQYNSRVGLMIFTAFRGLFDNRPTHGIPALQHLVHVLHLTWQRPRLFYVVVIFVCEYPASTQSVTPVFLSQLIMLHSPTIRSILERRE